MSLATCYKMAEAMEAQAYLVRFIVSDKCPLCGSHGHITRSDDNGWFCFRCNHEYKEAE